MGDCVTPKKARFETIPLALEVVFDSGKLTSDGGLIWLTEADEDHLQWRGVLESSSALLVVIQDMCLDRTHKAAVLRVKGLEHG